MAPKDYNDLLHTLENTLRKGKAQAATLIFQELLGVAPSLREMGKTIGMMFERLYDDLMIEELSGFAAWLGNHPAEDVSEPALRAVEAPLAAMREWEQILHEITGERLARDLRTQVRSRNIGPATQIAREIIRQGKAGPERLRMARLVGSLFGSLDHDRRRVDRVVSALQRDPHMDPALLSALDQERRRAETGPTGSEAGQGEMQWNRIHTDAVVRLIRTLPTTMTSDPTPADERRFYDAVQAVCAAALHEGGRFDFCDVARILYEFCPADPRRTGPVEGVEDVAFLRMNAAAKLTAVRVLRLLGQKDILVDQVIHAMQSPQTRDHKVTEILLRLMGGLANPRFFPYLSSALDDATFSRIRGAILDSFGRIGDSQCLKALFKILAGHSRARSVDPPMRREVGQCLASLGRIARHPRTSAEERNAIVLAAIRDLPDDRSLGRMALGQLCVYNPAGLSDEVKDLVVKTVIEGLWSVDTSVRLGEATAGDGELGFRQELADILIGMGPSCQQTLIKYAEPHAMQFSGAYWALGEVFAKIGNEDALPFLERILLSALVTNIQSIPEQMREYCYDAESGTNVPLSSDKIVASLIYAIQHRCGQRGHAFLLDLGRRIQSGERNSPGSMTDAALRELMVSAKLQAEGPSATPPAAGPALVGGPAPATPAAQPPVASLQRPREEEPLKQLVRDIRGKGLFGVKIEKRVSAVQEVAARRTLEAIPALCELLDSENRILATASETALTHLVRPTDPAPLFRTGVVDLLECLRKAAAPRARAIVEFLGALHPEDDPLRSMLLRFVQNEPDEEMKRRVASIFRLATEREATLQAPTVRTVGIGDLTEEEDEEVVERGPLDMSSFSRWSEAADSKTEVVAEGAEPDPEIRPSVELSKDDRRGYFLARQAWISGGKKGPEPKPPQGF